MDQIRNIVKRLNEITNECVNKLLGKVQTQTDFNVYVESRLLPKVLEYLNVVNIAEQQCNEEHYYRLSLILYSIQEQLTTGMYLSAIPQFQNISQSLFDIFCERIFEDFGEFEFKPHFDCIFDFIWFVKDDEDNSEIVEIQQQLNMLYDSGQVIE